MSDQEERKIETLPFSDGRELALQTRGRKKRSKPLVSSYFLSFGAKRKVEKKKERKQKRTRTGNTEKKPAIKKR